MTGAAGVDGLARHMASTAASAGVSAITGAVAAAALLAVSACGPRAPAGESADLASLRRQVAEARASVAALPTAAGELAGSGVADAELVVRLRSPLLLSVVESIAARYLDEVQLDLRPNLTVRETEQVHVQLGPLRVLAGEWHLTVRFQEIRARLRAGVPAVGITPEGSLSVELPVDATEGSGRAVLDFVWDARSVAGAVCRDFRVSESFAATVAPRTYRLGGHFDLLLRDGELSIAPRFEQRLEVSPEPTAASWRRVQEILASQDQIFRCGLALDPQGLEAELRRLLRAGFRFRLPEEVLRTVRLPTRVGGEVEVAERRFAVSATTAGLRLGDDWLWYGIDLAVASEVALPTSAGEDGAGR